MKLVKFLWVAFFFVLIVFAVGFAVLPLPGDATVVMYHFIDTPERSAQEKNVVSVESFRRQMKFLKDFGYRVIRIEDYEQIRAGKKSSRGKEIVLTFDDANYTFRDHAFPILQAFGYPSTVFVVSENMKQRIHGSMTTEEIRELVRSGLVTIGSHSQTHPVLSELGPESLEAEIRDSRRDLEQLLGGSVIYFAYPSGGITAEVADLVRKAGYHLAFTTSPKKLGEVPEGDFSLTRAKISRTSDSLFTYWFKISGIYGKIKTFRHFLFRR
ncbi:MAG: polysaccharide deacetylase family protein [Candidatus Omnitrophota bacterium]